MAIPSRQIGWSTKANLLWQISKQLERLICVAACECPTTTTTTTTAIPAFRLSFVDISFANGLVGDATNVNDWNEYLNLPNLGTPFDSVVVTGNEVALYGGTSIKIRNNAFNADGKPPVPYLTSVIDEGGRIIEIGDTSFLIQTTLTVFTAPNVTTIGMNAFNSCGIISVNFPLLVNIGNQAFLGCSNLSTVTFNSITALSDNCFNGCTSLSTINIPLLETIGDYCFQDCTSITSIDFPLVTYLGEGAFSQCTSLESIKFDLVTSIPGFTFGNTAIQTLTSTNFPILTTINQTSFGSCYSLTSVNLPSVTYVGYYGFGDCTALMDVQLPNVTYTEQYSFTLCSALTNLYMPSLTNLGASVGDNLVFLNTIGATLTFTIPAAFMTCNSGNPDGDIQYLQANNTVTIVTV
jgi:hypothetical protein